MNISNSSEPLSSGPLYDIFGAVHWAFFGIFLILPTVLAFWIAKKYGWHKNVLWVCFGIAVLSEIVLIVVRIDEFDNGFYLRPEYLPLHMCSVLKVLLAILIFSKNQRLKDRILIFMYPLAVAGAFMAILIPADLGGASLVSVRGLEYFVVHAMLVFFGLYIVITRPVRLDFKTYFATVATLFGVMIVAVYINTILGGSEGNVNYFFVSRAPIEGLPILNTDLGWHFYAFNLIWVGMLLIALTYIPAFVSMYKQRTKLITDIGMPVESGNNANS